MFSHHKWNQDGNFWSFDSRILEYIFFILKISFPTTALAHFAHQVASYLKTADCFEKPVQGLHTLALVASGAAETMETGEYCLELLQDLSSKYWF